MGEQNYEQEIDLKDLIFAVLHKWRSIISIAVVLGVLFGGYKFCAGYLHKDDGNVTAELQQIYNEELELYEKAKLAQEKHLENLNDRIISQEDYLTNSVLLTISPYSKPMAYADIFVKTDHQNESDAALLISDDADAIVNSYASIINNAANTINYEDNSGNHINAQYLKELVATRIDYQGNVVKIEVTYNNETEAKQILDILLEKVNNEYSMVQSKLGIHELIIMNVGTVVTTDPELADVQQKRFDTLSTLNKSKDDVKKAIGDLKGPSDPTVLSAAGSIKGAVKYGVLGVLLGGFLAVFCISVAFLMRNKLGSEKEMKARYGLRILGVFSEEPKKGVFAGIDVWLDRLQGIRFRQPSEVYEMIAANIDNYMEADQNLMVLGVASDDKVEQIAEELRKRLPNLEVQAIEAVNITADTIKRLPNAGQIILVEERGLSSYDIIDEHIEMTRSLNKEIIGCIVL